MRHQHEQEARIITAQTTLPMRGQLIGTVLCFFFGGIGWHLATNGHDGIAALLFGTTMLGLVTVFVLGRAPRAQNAETASQRPNKGKRK